MTSTYLYLTDDSLIDEALDALEEMEDLDNDEEPTILSNRDLLDFVLEWTFTYNTPTEEEMEELIEHTDELTRRLKYWTEEN